MDEDTILTFCKMNSYHLQICEEFKESSPDCLPCGLVLAGKQFSPILRHFGLQLVEHCIK